MNGQPEVGTFALMLPAERREALINAGDRFERWMGAAFPGKRFLLVDPVPGLSDDDSETLIVPVMGAITDDGKGKFAARPTAQLIREIGDRLAAFDPKASDLN